MKKRGFTLIEMLIVIVIIGILAGALIPRIGSARDKANDTAREANVRSLATAMVSYGMDHGYPSINTGTCSGASAIENHNVPGDGTLTGCQLRLSLTGYSIPAGNFQGQPTARDTYFYAVTSDNAHFVIYTILSGGPDANDAGNCNANNLTAGSFNFGTLNAETSGNAFCYFQ